MQMLRFESRAMDESSNKLQVIMTSPEDMDTQICRLGPEVLKNILVRIGGAVKIKLSDTHCVICTMWPNPGNSTRFIEVSSLVHCSEATSSTNDKTFITLPDIEVIPDIKPVTSITVTVIVDDFQKPVLNCSGNQTEDLQMAVKHCIKNLILSKHCTVDCYKTGIGQLFGVSYILIDNLEGSCDSPEISYGKITLETCLTVSKVRSRERFEQRQTMLQDMSRCRLAGLDREFQVVKQLTMFNSHPQNQTKIPLLPRGILLQGPPGTGKTSLVQQVAVDCNAFLVTVSGSEVYGSRPGETEENLKNIVEKAINHSKEGSCILFFDDVDALCPSRRADGAATDRRVVSCVFSLLERLNDTEGVTVLAATSNPGGLDLGIRRPGRLDKEILIGIPNMEKRSEILKAVTQNVPMNEAIDFDHLAECTPGFVGADLLSLAQHAQNQALQDYHKNPEQTDLSMVCVEMRHFEAALHFVTPSTQRGSDIVVDLKPIMWDDIGGLETVKTKLKQSVEWPLKHPASFARLGIPRPKGVLLYGPPGCAKTTLVRAAATSCHVTFLAISGGQLYSPYVGDSERKLAQVFQQARAGAPAILFIDEIDSVIGCRGSTGNSVQQRVASTLLNEMDGIGQKMDQVTQSLEKLAEGQALDPNSKTATKAVDNAGVLLVAATNRPDMLEDAVLRPGRIDRIIFVPPPNKEERASILKLYSRKFPLHEVNLDDIAERTERFTGADLESLCRETALHAMSLEGLSVSKVTQQHFYDVLNTLKPSVTPSQMAQYEKFQQQFGRR